MNAPLPNLRNLFLDSLQNLVSGIGTAKDKSVYTTFTFTALDRGQLEAAYRGDWIARKVVDLPAQDATRAWRAWQAENNEIEAIEALEKTFDIQQKVKRAQIRARLYGGAALILGVDGAGTPEQELDLERVQKDALKFVHVVSSHELTTGELNTDVLDPFYGQPKDYTAKSTNGSELKIHPSRVIRMIGSEVPDPTQATDGWGDSILQAVLDAIIAAGTVTNGGAQLVQEAKLDIIRIPDLSANLATAGYSARLTERFALASQLKSMYSMLLMDKEEEWSRVTSNFSALPDMLRLYLLIASGAADIPATRMLGQSPAGLSATGESDIRNYYDRIKSDQVTTLGPILTPLDEVLIRSALGKRDPSIGYSWNPLWQMTEAEKADVASKKANVFKIDNDIGLIQPELLQRARENQLIEDETYPGFELALEEIGNEPPPDPMEELAQQQEIMAKFSTKNPANQNKPAPFQKKKAVGDEVDTQWLIDLFREEDHPRDKIGRWTKLSGGDLTAVEYGAIDYYTGGGHAQINKRLRQGSPSAKDKSFTRVMDNLLDRSKLGVGATVYRGIDGKEAKQAEQKLKRSIGSEFKMKGYISTSKSRHVANNFGGYHGILFEIKVPKGSKGLDLRDRRLPSIPEEKEILLPRNSRFKIRNVSYTHNSTVVHLDLLRN